MVGDVAHELRTPLTNLRGYLQAARDGLVQTDRDLVDNLYEESMLLSRLVADLQELAQAEAGQLTLVPQAVAVDAIVDQAIGMLRPQADEKGITLETDLPSDLPAVARIRNDSARSFAISSTTRSPIPRAVAASWWTHAPRRRQTAVKRAPSLPSGCATPAAASRPSISPTSSTVSTAPTSHAPGSPAARD